MSDPDGWAAEAVDYDPFAGTLDQFKLAAVTGHVSPNNSAHTREGCWGSRRAGTNCSDR
jgi:hypothetical protein